MAKSKKALKTKEYVYFHNVMGSRFKVPQSMKFDTFVKKFNVRGVKFDPKGTPLVEPWWRME